MASKMLTFVTTGREMPEKRPAAGRRRDFAEIYARFDKSQAATQAGRCSQCGVPFCQVHCPVQNNIPDWLKLAAEGRLEEARDAMETLGKKTGEIWERGEDLAETARRKAEPVARFLRRGA